ncbi:hypothetical protein C8R44DRAFT_751821 [Mycena epipterygia]|nr:hypothetical protein C8R44DRAFT_751821 [Mycena epipterygia]
MAQLSPPTNASRPELSEREALIALISRLSLASADVEAKVALLLPPLAPPPPDPDTLWVAGVPKTPTELEDEIPAGSGEVWYVVIRGREPGLYRTYDEANAMTNGVPNQWQQKEEKPSRGHRLVPRPLRCCQERREYHPSPRCATRRSSEMGGRC